MRRLLTSCVLLLASMATLAVAPLWQYNSPSPILFDPAVGGDGTAYFATLDGKLRALTPAGTASWVVDPGGVAMAPVALDRGRIYVAVSSQQVRCYGVNGKMAWKLPLDKNVSTPFAITGDGVIIFATSLGDVYGVNETNGNVIWKYHAGSVVGPPSVNHEGNVFFAADSYLLSMDPHNGHVLWKKFVFNFSAVPIAFDQYDNMTYIRGTLLDVYDFQGNFLWEAYDESGTPISIQNVEPVVFGDMLLAAGSGGGEVYAFDSRTGVILWQYTTANADNPIKISLAAIHSFATDRSGIAYWCNGSGLFAYMDAATGYLLGWWPSLPLVGGDVTLVGQGLKGRAYFRCGSNRATILASTTEAGPGPGPWSQAGGSARHLQRRDDAPAVDLISPADGASISGVFGAQAQASDDFGLAGITFYLDANKVATSDNGTLTWSADSSSFQDGVYTLTALAEDKAGNESAASATLYVSNPVPVYGLAGGLPRFSWLSNGVDTKYQVTIAADPGFGSVVTTSSLPGKKWIKGTTWQPKAKQWNAVVARAAASATEQTTFYWRAVGKSGDVVTTRTFIMDKSK